MVRVLPQFDAGSGSPQLAAVTFQSSFSKAPLRSVRGKTATGRSKVGSFQWTSGVVAAVVTLLKAKLAAKYLDKNEDWIIHAGISSDTSSLAGSLDYALSKQPSWLIEMFGSDINGQGICRRLFLRNNPERKRPGPVSIVLNQNFLDPDNIKIEIDGIPVATDLELNRLLLALGYQVNLAAASRVPTEAVLDDRFNNHAQLKLDKNEVATAAILGIENIISNFKGICPSESPMVIAKIERELPRLLASHLADSVHRIYGLSSKRIDGIDFVLAFCPYGPTTIRVTTCDRDSSVLNIVLELKGCRQEFLGDEAIVQPAQHDLLRIYGPLELKTIANYIAEEAAIYWHHAYIYLRYCLANLVTSFNPSVVSRIYGLIRQHLATSCHSEMVSSDFSIFAHYNGKCRYLLDQTRYKRVQEILTSKSSRFLVHESIPHSRLIQTEAWYSTSVLKSADTMSYTEAVLPKKTWSGTPSVWKRPIPGFGASEIAVYGIGTSWAEPINLEYDSFSMCAVFSDESAEKLKGKFLNIPKVFQSCFEGFSHEISQISFGDGEPYCHQVERSESLNNLKRVQNV